MDSNEARLISVRDQAWASVRDYEEELRRIGHSGLSQPADLTLAMKACCLVAGDLAHKRREERNGG
jgi:hypothetical protein